MPGFGISLGPDARDDDPRAPRAMIFVAFNRPLLRLDPIGSRQTFLVLAEHDRDRLHHQLEFGQQIALHRLRQRMQVVEQTSHRHVVFIELPRRELLLDHPAEELRLRQAIRPEEALELGELDRSDPIARFKRADGLFTDAREAGHVLLGQTAHAPEFTKFQYEIHGFSLFH